MSDQRWDDEPGVSPQGYIIGCTGGCACQCDLPECGCHRTTRDTPEAALAAALLHVGVPVGADELAAAILAALDGWRLVPTGPISVMVDMVTADNERMDAEIARLRATLTGLMNLDLNHGPQIETLRSGVRDCLCVAHEDARAALAPSEPKAPNRPNPSKAEEKGCESWDPWKHA
jgi:hypothetical protein